MNIVKGHVCFGRPRDAGYPDSVVMEVFSGDCPHGMDDCLDYCQCVTICQEKNDYQMKPGPCVFLDHVEYDVSNGVVTVYCK